MPVDQKDMENMMIDHSNVMVNETQIFLNEEDFTKNIGKVIGYDCPFFGKILYIYMSDGYDRKKISYLEFLRKLYPLYSPENRPGYN